MRTVDAVSAEMERLLLMLSKGVVTDERKVRLMEELKKAYPECLDEEGCWNEVPLPDLEMLTEDTAYPVPFSLYENLAELLLDGMPEPEKNDMAKAMAGKMRKYCKTVDIDGFSCMLCYRYLKDKARAFLCVEWMAVDILTAVRMNRLFYYATNTGYAIKPEGGGYFVTASVPETRSKIYRWESVRFYPAPDARESLYMLCQLLGFDRDTLPVRREETLKELNRLLDRMKERYVL